MNERSVRADLAATPIPELDPAALAAAAATLGRGRLRRRRAARGTAATTLALVTAVAAYVVAVPGAAPAEAAVVCHADRVEVRGNAAVGREGVRLAVTNATDNPAILLAGGVATIVPPGRSEVDVPVRPGRLTLTCQSGAATAFGTIDVRDPRGLFVDDQVSCGLTEVVDLRGDGAIETGDPVSLTGAHLKMPENVTVEPAGYPAATGRRVIRVRSGKDVLGVAIWHAMPGPGWVLDEVHLCPPVSLAV